MSAGPPAEQGPDALDGAHSASAIRTPASAGGAGRREDPLARVVFAALVIASFAAFGITQRLKHTPTIVQSIELSASFTPGSTSANGVERISFKIQHPDRVRVEIIDSQGNTVRTLAHHLPMQAYKRVNLYWNGHEAHGRHAPPGSYRVRITLLRQKREVLSPAAFDLKAPA